MKTTWLILLLPLLLAGCATTPRPSPLTQAEIISMTKAGMWDEDIIRRIDATRTVFRLSAEDVVRLRNEGVSERVVNYMLDTYTRAVAAEQRRQDYYYYGGFHYSPWSYHRHPYWW